MPKKRIRSFDEMQELRNEYRKALKIHRAKSFELSLNKDIQAMEDLGPEPEKPSWYELTKE